MQYDNQVGIKISNIQQQNQNQGDFDCSLLNISAFASSFIEKHNGQISSPKFEELQPQDQDRYIISAKDSVDENSTRKIIEQLNDNSTLQIKELPLEQIKGTKNFSIQYDFQKMERKRRGNLFQGEFLLKKDVWKQKWMQIFYYLAKFRTIARQVALLFRPHMLTKKQVRMINDLASDQKHKSSLSHIPKLELSRQFTFQNFSKFMSFRNYRKMIKFIVKYFGWLFQICQKIYELYILIVQLIFSNIPLFHYLSYSYIVWETIIFIASTILFIYIPFEYSFLSARSDVFQIYFSKICPVVYSIDVFIRANTKSTETGNLVENHIQIFKQYFKTEMIPDILSILSLNYQINNIQATYFFFFYRVSKSFRILDIFKEQFLLRMKISGIISLTFLAAQAIYFAHLICCVWNAVGTYESQYNYGWLIKYNVQNVQLQIRYLYSFYYSVITMTTIGYGDITPQSDLEMLTVIFVALISCGVFGYSINSIENIFKIGSILYDFKQKKNIYLQGLAMINKYFRQYDVDLELQARARKYLDYIYTDKKEDLLCSIDQLSNLTEYLQDEIKVNVYTKRLKKIQIFKDLFSDETLSRIALKMKEKILSHDQDIISISHDEPFLYIIHSGEVTKYTFNLNTKKVKELYNYQEGQFFGFENFITENYYEEFNFKSKGICCVLQIQLSEFLQEIKKNEEEYEKYCYLRDEVKFNQNLKAVNISCESCNLKTHTLKQCPFIFYEGRNKSILKNYFRNIQEQIKNLKRNTKRKKFQAINDIKFIKDQQIQFIEQQNQNNLSDLSSNLDFEDSNQQIQESENESEDENEDEVQQQEEEEQKLQNASTNSKSLASFKSQKSQKTFSKANSLSDESSIIQSAIERAESLKQANKIEGTEKQQLDSQVVQKKATFNLSRKTVQVCENLNSSDQSFYSGQEKKELQTSKSLKHIQSLTKKRSSILATSQQQNEENKTQSTKKSSKIENQINQLIESLLEQRLHSLNRIDKKRRQTIMKKHDAMTIQSKFIAQQFTAQDLQLYIYDFEEIKDYIYYYPNYNHLQVISQENKNNRSSKQVILFKKNVYRQIAMQSITKRMKKSNIYIKDPI
ncbi:cyclic nucleotide-binding domain protein (macronuclear) [Tetrahymena thermophila SB210]|uniref:Cyclic nucleotide-binding domain protein n=1 Tax=Tetrahymena thermophila (strain SB210) TaxID=312017 RepID=W7X0R1_TETTS|nr:cyclic nucleotide-binding domain protein [Tetrahymena thermophila SB210]EWS72750.1 cyclic nucleotide-binding domain protein [Tetrahymena thermophila SB210]|eukprot:XP_012654728.1 cyclic nucleotide-binding domain protein [Tetrahymena thermophila SB210]